MEKRAEARKPKEKVGYKMIQQYIEEHYDFKEHTAYIAEVKRSLVLPMYDAPNTVEELKHQRPYPTERMGMAEAGSTVEKRALVLTKKGHIALFVWRKVRDSDPRRLAPQRFSRPPHSTALPTFRIEIAEKIGNFLFSFVF